MRRCRAGSKKAIRLIVFVPADADISAPWNDTTRMAKLFTENRKLPAWIGSVLIHAVLLLLVLFWFSLSPSTKSAPGERNAAGSIVFQSKADDRQQIFPSATDSANAISDTAEIFSERLADAALSQIPPTPTLAPGQGASDTSSTESAADLMEMLRNGIANNKGAGTDSGETTVQVFGTSGKGMKFMYVFDRSDSMYGRRLQRAKEELVRSLDSLGEFHQFNIIFYNGVDSGTLWRPGPPRKLVFATPSNKESAVRYISGITAEGGTRHFAPLQEAIAHRPDVIFFLTDGEAQDDLSPAQLREIERINNRVGRGVQINVIQFISGGATNFPSTSLQQLAADNHGQYICVNVLTWR